MSCASIYNEEDGKLFCYLTSVLHGAGLSLGKKEGLMWEWIVGDNEIR